MALCAQRKTTEVIHYGDLDQWVVRKITESAIIGKGTKVLYCVGPTDTITENKPYEPKGTPWGSSNVMAKVSGITQSQRQASIPRGGKRAIAHGWRRV